MNSVNALYAYPSATSRALSIKELLEEVLSYLPFQDLIIAQQVCTSWRTLITNAPPPLLRQHLFLESVEHATDRHKGWEMYEFEEDQEFDGTLHYGNLPSPTHLNPLLRPAFTLHHYCSDGKIAFQVSYAEVKRILAWPPGMWEDMLISQPVIRKTRFSLPPRFLEENEMLSVENVSGVRIGHMMRQLNLWVKNRTAVGWEEDELTFTSNMLCEMIIELE